MMMQSPIDAYRKVAVDNTVETASNHKLVLMLFDAARLAVTGAIAHMANKNVEAKGLAVSRAISIIGEGLQASLDVEAGGEIAEQLYSLYDYMVRRLLEANRTNSSEMLTEVGNLLKELHDAWAEIGNDPAVLRANATQG